MTCCTTLITDYYAGEQRNKYLGLQTMVSALAATAFFALGGAHGFSEKLQNAISEVTRALIYEQKAEDIYDLIGESTQAMLESLNQQFLPAVRFVNANITHAEPSDHVEDLDDPGPAQSSSS